ncbi:hypothetical protein OG2516_15594 [Oceanicola granulosus HTCC2516]|uniref:Type II toxin-antitoxin system RelE/ParE family toxin n=1 Tax=Oceanicola granulosus (strain ATCC BAA-861 / DSM 15982 / KCTC 12143 / HTCC2516) TaxID=314256 RepID=Q2CF94_OCEGH|nr:type II toxin-antitoxin system RelE/ParE family toxin [Oceanicola granulosus]EAR51401.1 hypothetical protein OG2516_15594 [Oceanicola granulosus HTCC2516]
MRWELTPGGEARLVEIFVWTLETFGPDQMDLYERQIVDRLDALARGDLPVRYADQLTGQAADGVIGFIRTGEHFALFLKVEDVYRVFDFLHVRSDIPDRLRTINPDPKEV